MDTERCTKSELLKNISNYQTTFKSQFQDLDDDAKEIQCLLCKEKYSLPDNEQTFLSHLFTSHRLIIGDVEKIASLKSYIHYWRVKLKEEPIVNFCTTILMDCTPDGQKSKNESYFLLSDCLPEDKTLREELHRAKLEWILSVQTKERTDNTFNRGCMFCRAKFSGLRSIYLKHLYEKHNMQLGKPENLVFIDKFLDKIEENIEKLICIYCEKQFKSRIVLREHMRKKGHKRVNATNKYYDKFYVINYLEIGRNWRDKEKTEIDAAEIVDDNDDDEDDEDVIISDKEDDDDEWSDWNEDTIVITCLFCKHSNKEYSTILEHMIQDHNFDLETISKSMDFYEKIRLVNYIRHQIHLSQCIYCCEEYANVTEHMKSENHYKLPESKHWLQPQFYFPMFEDDSFLYNLDVNNSAEVAMNEIESQTFTEALHISKED